MATKSLALSGSSFWSSATPGTTVYQDGDLLYVVLDDRAMMKVVLRTAQELFHTTVERERLSRQFAVVVNANFYDVSNLGLLSALTGSGPIAASATTPVGRLVERMSFIGGRPAPDLFYLDNAAGPLYGYSFGFGDPPSTGVLAAVGGLGPLIIGGLRYGVGNLYKPGTPSSAPATGAPPAQFAGALVQRNNNTYVSAAAKGPRTGKAVIARSSGEGKLIILVQPHAAPTGISHDNLRDKLFALGVDDAVFLDGSDSVMLMVDGVWLVRQAARKDQTNTIGIGFSLT
jgi:hypothetical protein